MDAKMPAEAVARAAGHEPKGGGRADQLAGNFIERAVATDGDDERGAAGERGAGEGGGVERRLGQDEFGVDRGGKRAHCRQDARDATGEGIDDEERAQGRFHQAVDCAEDGDKK